MPEKYGSLLIVDDESAICTSLRRLLRNSVRDITLSISASEAIEEIQKKKFDVVISDLNMPGMSGTELFMELSHLAPEVIQIVITGQVNYAEIVNVVNKCNLYGYIAKPWDDSTVTHMVAQALDLKKLRDEQANLYDQIESQNRKLNKLNHSLVQEMKSKDYFEQKLKDELQNARSTQARFIPSAASSNSCFTGFNYPARYLSGDFYDYIEINKNETLFCMGDVSGKGVVASLLMVKCISLFRGLSNYEQDVGRLMAIINEEVCLTNVGNMFVTLVIGKIDRSSDTINVANAGHLPVLIVEQGKFREIKSDNIPVGIKKEEKFDVVEICCPKSKIFVYSDGLVDRKDKDGNEFGFDKIKRLLIEVSQNSSEELKKQIVKKLDLGDAELEDDATLLVINNDD